MMKSLIDSIESTDIEQFKPSSRVFDKLLGGGSIFDLGCYPLSFDVVAKDEKNNYQV